MSRFVGIREYKSKQAKYRELFHQS